jgi:cyclic-di-GMP-binding protein
MLSLMAFVCEASARIDSEVHMPSFDVVSELDDHEIANAVDQANREVQQRFDFKDSGAKYELKDYTVTLQAQVDFQLKQMLDILLLRLSKRGIDVACAKPGDPEITLNAARQTVTLRHGIDSDTARRVQRLIKDSKLKVQAAIQGEQVRVTGKQRDDLQAAMALLRGAELEIPLQYKNFRD